jgi:GNAT superfamily N-acetyltransferase
MAVAMHDASLFADIALDPEKLAGWIADAIADANHLVLIAEDDGEPAGLLAASTSTYLFGPERIASDHAVYVRPTRRGGVAARKLIDGYRGWATAQGCREACLATSTGVDAAEFYNRLGFSQVGTVHKVRLGG